MHAVIAATDGVTVAHLGRRSRSQDHESAAELLIEVPVPGAREHVQIVRAVVAIKNRVAYEDRAVDPSEAATSLKRAQRHVAWALQSLE